MADEMKTCGNCGQAKPLVDFPIQRQSSDGHHTYCFECKRAKDRESSAAYRARDPEQHRRSARKYARTEVARTRNGDAALLTKYGLTREAFDAKLVVQGSRCPLCPPDAEEPASWHVDHDHSCCEGQQTCGECLRDILCSRHNIALGQFDDDPGQLRAAADYIERHRARIEAAGTTPWQPKGVPSGPQHSNWKGDDASQNAFRLRVWRELGSADHCVNGCVADRYEWVCAKGANPADPASYIPMCRKCNVIYHGQDGAGHANAKLTAGQAAEIRTRYLGEHPPAQRELAAEYGVSISTISLIVHGERYASPEERAEAVVADQRLPNGRRKPPVTHKPSEETRRKQSEAHKGMRGRATISEGTVREIKRRLADGEIGRRLAAEFGISVTMVSDIKTGRTWADVA
jgi:hypothetical protein